MNQPISIQDFLDTQYGGEDELAERMASEVDLSMKVGEAQETPLHVATRRRRSGAVDNLTRHRADINATNAFGKTAFAHAANQAADRRCNFQFSVLRGA